MAKIVVLGGAGHIGSCGVRELVKRAPEAEVVIADYNLDAAQRLAAEVGGRPAVAVKADARDAEGLVKIMAGADVVVNMVGPYYLYGEPIAKAAIRAKVNLVDICDDGDATKKILGLHEEAKSAGICIVVGLGATPGITNLMAKRGAENLDRVDDIDTAWAWTAIDPKMTGRAIVDHYFHAVTGDIETYRDGSWITIPAVSNPKLLDFVAPIGLMEVSEVGHPEPVTIPRYIKVSNVTNRGGVWPARFTEIANFMKEIGLPQMTEMTIGGVTLPAREVATQIVLALPVLATELVETMITEVLDKYGEFGLEGVTLRVDVTGERAGLPARYSYGCKGPADFLTAFPSVVGALMLTRGQIRGAGAFAPEGIVDQKVFFNELAGDIAVEETSVNIIR